LKKDPACKKDLAKSEPARVGSMAKAYDKWWDDIYPVMIRRGGDLEMKWDKKLLEKNSPSKSKVDGDSKTKKAPLGEKNLNS
jgi:hypothetical protein